MLALWGQFTVPRTCGPGHAVQVKNLAHHSKL
jgi:hypothetical protein